MKMELNVILTERLSDGLDIVFSNQEDYEIFKGKEILQDLSLQISIPLAEVFQ
jgi:hypothetical protein